MDIEAFMQAQLARPITHRVVTHYADGATKSLDVRSAGQAENFAIGERRKIGRNLISRETGETVRVVKIEIVTL